MFFSLSLSLSPMGSEKKTVALLKPDSLAECSTGFGLMLSLCTEFLDFERYLMMSEQLCEELSDIKSHSGNLW